MYNKIDFSKIDLTAEPPAEEPARQYYYIAKCRQYVKSASERLGRTLTSTVVTFGCQMNARDSEKLAGILECVGYQMSDCEEADLVIYNTCTVRDNANQRVYGRLGVLHGFKKKNPHMKIALCGCMMQEESVIEKLRKSYRFIDLIFGTHNIFKFAELLCTMFESGRTVIDIWKDTDKIVEDLPVERKYPFKSGINIMFGCNNFCSYCIVPYVRGRERRTGTPAASMPDQVPEEIVKEGFDKLLKTVQDTARNQVARWQGQTLPALVEEQNAQDNTLLTGRLSNNTIVHFPGDASLIGRIIHVRLKECHGFYYMGEAVETPKF